MGQEATTAPSRADTRKLGNYALLGALAGTVLLGLVSKRAHVVAGVVLTALAAHHVWVRRGAL